MAKRINHKGRRDLCECGDMVEEHRKDGCHALHGYYDNTTGYDSTHVCECSKTRSELLKEPKELLRMAE